VSDASGTLERLPDPQPDEWLSDRTQMMQSARWYGYPYFGPTYGNFWARRPCRVWPHRWLALGQPKAAAEGPYARTVHRCQRCGSQVFIGAVPTPVRGRW
jgi:hypothetical protein